MKKPVVMRLYPEPDSSLFVRIIVHPTKKAMLEHSKALVKQGISTDFVGRACGGFCANWQLWHLYPSGRSQRQPCVAEVSLCPKYLGTRVTTHELFHASLAWARRVGIDGSCLTAPDTVTAEEERAAYCNGELNRLFVNRMFELGLYPL